MPLKQYSTNKYSQNGEDGILLEVLDRIRVVTPLDHWCVEFGAWDGVKYSNTCNLIRERQYKAVMIEGDLERVKELRENHPSEDVIKIERFVSLEGPNSLDNILSGTPVPVDFDLLSVDIDGNDFHVWQSLSAYRPKVLVIEYNPTIPNDVEYVQEASFAVKRGASALSLTQLGKSKGYALVEATPTNLVFVREEFVTSVLADAPGAYVSLSDVRDDRSSRVYVYVGYDGTVMLSRPLWLPWHETAVQVNGLQAVPDRFRKYPGDFEPSEQQSWREWLKTQSSPQSSD